VRANKGVATMTIGLVIVAIIVIAGIGIGVYYATLPAPTVTTTATTTTTTTPTTTTTTTTAPAEVVEVRLWHTYSPHEENVARALLDEFEADNPNIKVTMEAVPYDQMQTHIMTAVAAGVAPDLVRMDIIWVPQYADIGALLEVDNYMAASGVSSSSFYPGPLSTCVWKGTTYGLPLDTNTRVLIYRKDLFQEAGVSVPTTWDEFLAAAKALTKDTNGDGVTDQWGFVIQDTATNTWQFGPFLWQAGGDVLNENKTQCIINNAAGVSALQFLVDMIQVDKVAQDPYIVGGWPGQWGLISTGEAAMMHDGPWFKGILEGMDPTVLDKIGIAVMPAGVQQASVVGGEDLVAFKQCKHPDAAWKVMQYMTSDHFQLGMFPTGQIPTLKTAGADPALSNDPFWSVFMQQLETARARPVHPKETQMDEIIHRHLEAAFTGTENVQQALDAMAAEIDALL